MQKLSGQESYKKGVTIENKLDNEKSKLETKTSHLNIEKLDEKLPNL